MQAVTRPADVLRERATCYERIGAHNMTSLCKVVGAFVPEQSHSPANAALWRDAELR